ncbi:MAG: hypothetical protein GY851_31755 [bacterium]|nr:hypothetical protein [bacterium]
MNDTHDATALLAVLLTSGAGRATAHRAHQLAGQLKMPLHEILGLPKVKRIRRLGPLNPRLAETLGRCTRAAMKTAERLVRAVDDAGGESVPLGAPGYPPRLLQALETSAPPVLFLVGARSLLDEPAAAIVGARLATAKGLSLATKSAAALAGHGVPIVSGGARGVDSAAHASSLSAGGGTIVVLPQGLLTYDPPAPIREGIDDGRVLLLSAFAPDTSWQTHAAVTRNATIAALADLVCVIEPAKQGGSIRTARYALKQGARLLVHVNRRNRAVLEPLQDAGALPLVEPGASFDIPRITRMWDDRPPRPQGQTDLF